MSKSQKHGRWTLASNGEGVVCSVCGYDYCNVIHETKKFYFCPHCGAEMENVGDETAMNKIPYEQRKEVYMEAIRKHGITSQVWKFIEEVGELQEAISKYRSCRDDAEHVAEEIADVTIMLEQLRIIFGVNDLVCGYMDSKVERLKEKLEENPGEPFERF